MEARRVAVIGGTRIPFVRSFAQYLDTSNQEMMTFVLNGLVEKFGLEGKVLGDVVVGAVMKHASDFNLARECVLGTKLNPSTPGMDIQRACGTSLEAVATVANRIALGQIEHGIAGGTDTNSDLPISLQRSFARRIVKLGKLKGNSEKLRALRGFSLKELKPDVMAVVEPRTHLSMGEHCELMAKEWKISRAEQDQLTLASHQHGNAAYERGFYKGEVLPFKKLERDGTLRADTSLEKLAKLPPVFDRKAGTLTAGNSTALTDGASAVYLASEEYAKNNNLKPLAYLTDFQSSGVDFVGGEGLLMAPTIAVSQLLERNHLKLQDFDFYEIHEAFAAQVLCTLKAWESAEYCKKRLGRSEALGSIDRSKLNVNGGSVALGHPFAATGTRIVATLAKILSEQGKGRGLISVCTAGGMGVAAIMERS